MNMPLFFTFLSGNSGQDFLNDTRSAQTLFSDSLDYQWYQYIGPNNDHPIWVIFVKISLAITLVIFMYLAYDILEKLAKNDFQILDFKYFIAPLIALMLLSNNGRMTGALALGLRNIGTTINYSITDFYQVYQESAIEYDKANANLDNAQVRAEIDKAFTACQDEYGKPTMKDCVEDVLEASAQAATDNGKAELGTKIINFITGVKNNVYDLSTYAVSSAFLADERVKLYAMAIAFNVGADLALFMTALTAPLAVATSIIPMGKNSLIAWFTANWMIMLTRICYTIMVSLLADVQNNGRGFESFVFANMLGRYIPMLAILIGAGGGFALYSSLLSIGIGTAEGFNPQALLKKFKPKTRRRA